MKGNAIFVDKDKQFGIVKVMENVELLDYMEIYKDYSEEEEKVDQLRINDNMYICTGKDVILKNFKHYVIFYLSRTTEMEFNDEENIPSIRKAMQIQDEILAKTFDLH